MNMGELSKAVGELSKAVGVLQADRQFCATVDSELLSC